MIPQRDQFDALPIQRTRLRLFEMAVSSASLGGPWAEFGVKEGFSARMLLSLQSEPAPLYLFDSWDGLPEDWVEDGETVCRKGKFAWAQPPDIEGATNVRGWFDDTLPGFQFTGPLSVIHVDSDLESSARTVLRHVPMASGTVIIFDEFFASRNGFTEPGGDLFGCGECRAWVDEVKARGLEWRYIARTTRNRVAVRIH